LQLIPKEFIITSLSSSTHILLDPSLNFNVLVSDHHRAAGRLVVSFAWALDSWDKCASQPEELYSLGGGEEEEPAVEKEEEQGQEMAEEDVEGEVASLKDEAGILVVKEELVVKAEQPQDANE